MPDPQQIAHLQQLVDRFHEQLDAYKSGHYNETQVRRDFIDPLFKLLGWDIDNTAGDAEAYRDVIHEDSFKIGTTTHAPDYCFRIGGTRKFFLEAKKPSVHIKEDVAASYQLRRYGWSAKLPICILTDFEEFAVYDTRIKPFKTDKVTKARIDYLTFDQYVEKWDDLYSRFSKEAVRKGAFDRYVETQKIKKGTAQVDAAFLAEIESWRGELARNIALRNPGLSTRDLNFAVQAVIDRIIFLRMCEDRGIENYGRLQALQNGTQVYPRLCQLFQQADDRYNSGLFHFKEEKGRATPPDSLTLGLQIDDKVLKAIFKNLYYPDSPYEFSALPTEILGQVYEQFLGKVIRLKGRRAVIEEKPEVRKAGGVYYTPQYIVDYIVRNTVGELLENKKPGKAVNQIKILDPACGSGSFLLGAYQYLLNWYRDEYAKDPKKHKKVLYRTQGDEWRLTTEEKKRILLTHIHGVDIDPQAVEVTKLSLLLKVLEGENDETLRTYMKLFHDRALPDLAGNIKCGNSLIGPDFYQGRQMGFLDEEEQYRINAFDWHAEFPGIMQSGGFDAVIGNPPYVRQELLGQGFKEYAQRKYETYHGVADLYVYFVEKAVSLLKKNGLFSYIMANKWMRANYGEPLRRWMKRQRIEEIVDFGDLPVFQKVSTYPCIVRIRKANPKDTFQALPIQTLAFESLQSHVEANRYPVNQATLDDQGWSLTGVKTEQLLAKIKTKGVPLGEYVEGKIFYGIKTGLNKAFVIDDPTRQRLIAEDPKSAGLIKPFLLGRDIKRYKQPSVNQYLILVPKGWTNANQKGQGNAWNWFQENYPSLAHHLKPYKEAAQRRYDKGDYWWELRACDYYQEFERPKFLLPDISLRGNFTLDQEGKYYCVNTAYIISSSDKALLGILNSSLITLFYQNLSSTYRGGYLRFIYQYLVQLPIYRFDSSNKQDSSRHDQMVTLVERMLELNRQLDAAKTAHDRNVLQRQIDATDREIDQLVYDLYGLTGDEIALVEASVK